MPKQKNNDYYLYIDDPDYKNLSEVYNKTGTTKKDWEPWMQEIREWYLTNRSPDFKTHKGREKEEAFIVILTRKLVDRAPNLLEGLSEDGIRSTLTFVIRRVCYNIRRNHKGEDSDSPTSRHESSSSPVSTRRRRSQSAMYGEALDPWPIGLKATYKGKVVRMVISDVAQSANPPLTRENVMDQMTLEIFVRPFKEDLEIENKQVTLQFVHPNDKEPTKLLKDRHLRGALAAVVSAGAGSCEMSFEFVPIDNAISQQHGSQPAAATQHLDVAKDPNSIFAAASESERSHRLDQKRKQDSLSGSNRSRERSQGPKRSKQFHAATKDDGIPSPSQMSPSSAMILPNFFINEDVGRVHPSQSSSSSAMVPYEYPVNDTSSPPRPGMPEPIQSPIASHRNKDHDGSGEKEGRRRHLPQAKNEETLPDSSDSDFDPDYDISRRESKRSRRRPSQAEDRNTPRSYLGRLSLRQPPNPSQQATPAGSGRKTPRLYLGRLSLRQPPNPSQQATPAGSGGSFHVQISSPTSDNNVATPKAVSDPGECPNTDSQNGHDSCSVQQGDLGGQSSLENPDTHPATTIQEYTQEPTASETVHAERKVDQSAKNVAPDAVSISSTEEASEDVLEMGPQTSPSKFRYSPTQMACDAQRWASDAAPEDKELVERIRKGFSDALVAHHTAMAQRDEGIANAQTAHDEAMAQRDEDEEDTIGEDDTFADQNERAMAILSRAWPTKVTEHLCMKDGRYADCVTLFCPNDRSNGLPDKVRMQGLNVDLYPYQVFGIFVLFEMEIFQNGGYLADEMGLGKTVEAFGLICLNRLLALNRQAVREARDMQRYDQHLKKGTPDQPQPADAKCPSDHPFGIQCTCIDAGVSNKLIPSYGPNLVLSTSGLLAHWMGHAKHLDTEAKAFNWVIRQAHGDVNWVKGNHGVKLSKKDRELVEKSPERPFFSARHDCSNLICFTTSQSYKGQVAKEMAEYIAGKPRQGRTSAVAAVYKEYDIGWSRILVDEAHVESNPNAGTIKLVQSINNRMKGEIPRKILITGTPFESSPQQMAGWIGTLEDDRWSRPRRVKHYPRMRFQQLNLQHCTSDALKQLGRTHKELVKTLQKGKKQGQAAFQEHKEKMTVITRTLWLRRTGESLFLGKPLVEIPPNCHYDCLLAYPKKYHHALDEWFVEVTRKIQEEFDKQMADYKRGLRLIQPQISDSRWLIAAHRARILSSFPELSILPDFSGMKFTLDEVNEHKWLRTKTGKLYELATSKSPYEQHIRKIAGFNTCPKLRALFSVLKQIWGIDAKVVIMTMSPVSALIVYWAIRMIWNRPVALIYGQQRKPVLTKIIRHFQEGKDGPECEDLTDEPVPQILVGTTLLLSTGFTLTAARHVVIFDTEWLSRDEQQGIKRVNRIGQDQVTQTIKFVNRDSRLDMAIYGRQGARRQMLEMVQRGTTDHSNREDIRALAEDNGDDYEDENGVLRDGRGRVIEIA